MLQGRPQSADPGQEAQTFRERTAEEITKRAAAHHCEYRRGPELIIPEIEAVIGRTIV